MSNFWIEVSKDRMPVSVQKCEFQPTMYHSLGSRWVNFGKLAETPDRIAALERENAHLKQALKTVSTETRDEWVLMYSDAVLRGEA